MPATAYANEQKTDLSIVYPSSNPAPVVAVVPARGGSKGIPGKNTVELGGRPLLVWTVDAALRSGVCDRVIVSSDDEEILTVAERAGAERWLRDVGLGDDHVHAVHPVLEVVEALGQRGEHPGLVLMLLPTSPFRSPEHIAEAVALYRKTRPPSVISVTRLDKQLIHLRNMSESGVLEPFAPFDQLTAQRQEQSPLFGLNGSIYVADAAQLLSSRTFHVPGAIGYEMATQASIDINEPEDLQYARTVLALKESV